MKENTMATNFEPHECVIFIQSTKIGTHENKAIHSMILNSTSKEHLIFTLLHIGSRLFELFSKEVR